MSGGPTVAGGQSIGYLSPTEVAQILYNAGFRGSALTTMTAISMAEDPSGQVDVLNNTPATGDYSVGLFQVNYFGNLLPSRTKTYGAPQALAQNPLAQAVAAFALSGGGSNFSAWSTYTSGAYTKNLDTAHAAASSVTKVAPVFTNASPPHSGIPGSGVLGDIGSAVGSAASTAAGVVAAPVAAASSITGLIGKLTNMAWWDRVGQFALGGTFFLVGLVIFISTTKPGQAVESSAVMAAAA